MKSKFGKFAIDACGCTVVCSLGDTGFFRLQCLGEIPKCSYLKLGGKLVMRRAATFWPQLLFCQKLGGQLPTLPTRQLGPCKLKTTGAKMFLRHIVY